MTGSDAIKNCWHKLSKNFSARENLTHNMLKGKGKQFSFRSQTDPKHWVRKHKEQVLQSMQWSFTVLKFSYQVKQEKK